MSLDVYLTRSRVIDDEVFWANITHNLNTMAKRAGVYEVLWRPGEIGIRKAAQIVPVLREGIAKMLANPGYYKQFDAPNGWGTYDDFVPWLQRYLTACENNPDADVAVSR